MAKKNNFDDAMSDFENRFTLPDMMAIEKRLKDTHHSMQVNGDVLNLFLPNIMKTFSNIFGGFDNDSNTGRSGASPESSDSPIKLDKPKAPGKR